MQASVNRIHNAAMAILEKVGIKIHHPEICAILHNNGIKVDQNVAVFTENQVMRWIGKAPSQFTLQARNPAHDAVIGGGKPQYAAGYGCPEIVDAAGRRRSATLGDYVRFVRLVQQCDSFRINGGILAQPAELAADQTHLAMTYATLLHSDKCLMGQPGCAESSGKVMTMAAMVFGGRQALKEKPRVLTLVNTLSPLQIDRIALETIKVHAEYGQALLITAGVMSGTTAPITAAGALALGNAEVLAATAISQMLHEGTPVVMGLVVTPADMRTAEVRLGAPNHAASFRYIRALADLYGLPCRCGGCVTDAPGLTHQSGCESMLNMLATLQSGADLILHSAGILDSFKAMSFEKFIADLEAIRMVEHYLTDIPVDEASLALPVISETGPGGEFLTHPHTLANCRSVPFKSMLGGAQNREKSLGARENYLARINSTLEKLLSDYRQPLLAPELLTELESYLIREGLEPTCLETIRQAATAA